MQQLKKGELKKRKRTTAQLNSTTINGKGNKKANKSSQAFAAATAAAIAASKTTSSSPRQDDYGNDG